MRYRETMSPSDSGLGRLRHALAKALGIKRVRASRSQLEASEQRFRELVERLPIMIYLDHPDPTASNIYTAPASEAICGYTSQDWADDPDLFDKILHPEDHERVWAEHQAFYASGGVFSHCYRVIAKDGRVVWVQDDAVLVHDAHGKPLYVQGCWQDITRRHEAEEAVTRNEQRYRELFENANDMIIICDLAEHVISVNAAFERVSGYSRAELEGKPITNLMKPESVELTKAMTRAKLDGEESTSYELEFRAKDGRIVPAEMNSRLIYADGDAIGAQGILRDLTERRSFEEQQRHSQKMEAVGQLTGGVAHEFNNLLMAMSGYAEFALMEAQEAGLESLVEHLTEIQDANSRAADLTGSLLAFSRQQQQRVELLDLCEVVASLEPMLRQVIGEHIEVYTDVAAELPLVKADPGQLQQVLMNLAVNARDAMAKGGRLGISTVAAQEDGREWAVLRVTDNGSGMDATTKAKLFEPFFTTKEVGEGTGLGLSTVYGIVEQSGGHVEVTSTRGEGSIFSIYLPAADKTEVAEPRAKPTGAVLHRASV
jgi:two-component system cell cycle sensor histidine kinase/response regulator CckA